MNRPVVWSLAILAAVNCLWVAVIFGTTQLSPGQPALNLFPLPGFYLLEIATIGILTLAAAWKASQKWLTLLSVSAGILLAFFVLGGFSLGPYLLPALVGQVVLIILLAKEYGASLKTHTAWLLGAVFGQAGSMLLLMLVINFLKQGG